MPEGRRPDPPNRTIRAAFSGAFGNLPWSNIMWFYATGSGEISSETLVTLANDLFGVYAGAFQSPLSNSWVFDLVELVLQADPEPLVANSDHVSVQGSNSGVYLPASCAACISWPIAAHYKGGHPRTYLTGIPQSALATAANFSGAWRSDLSDRASQFHTECEALGPYDGIASLEHGVVSFVRDKLWRTPPVFYRIRSGAYVDGRVDTQRRRLGPDLP